MYTWLKLRNGEKRTNQSHRARILRGFSKYMNMINDKNYVLPQKLYSCGDKYNAHIYSKDELDLIFYKIDNLVEEQPNKQLKNRSSQFKKMGNGRKRFNGVFANFKNIPGT